MKPARLLLAVVVFVGAASLDAGPAEAALFRGRPVRVYLPAPDRDHMPGWDWWRTYPYSRYNYGRNPYNPIILPYPPPYYPPYYGPANAARQPADGAMFPSPLGQPVQMPHPTGEVRVPPPGGAIVQVRVPETFAHILFDGERTYTEGTTALFRDAGAAGRQDVPLHGVGELERRRRHGDAGARGRGGRGAYDGDRLHASGQEVKQDPVIDPRGLFYMYCSKYRLLCRSDRCRSASDPS